MKYNYYTYFICLCLLLNLNSYAQDEVSRRAQYTKNSVAITAEGYQLLIDFGVKFVLSGKRKGKYDCVKRIRIKKGDHSKTIFIDPEEIYTDTNTSTVIRKIDLNSVTFTKTKRGGLFLAYKYKEMKDASYSNAHTYRFDFQLNNLDSQKAKNSKTQP